MVVPSRSLPPPLPLRVLLTAEPFGFGPSAAIAQIFPHLRSRLATLAYAGSGHTLDIQAGLAYDRLHDLGAGGVELYNGFARIIADYDAVVAACDFRAAELAHRAGIPVAIYDPLAWYWKIPPVGCAVDLYIAQDFFGVREALHGHSFRRLVVVPALIPLDLHGQEPREDLALLNLGGLRNPYLSHAECAAYAKVIADAVLPVMIERFADVEAITSAETARALHGRHPRARTVSPVEAQGIAARCRFAVMTPGLGNIYEAAALSARVLWLPPANDSQGQQIGLLRERNLAPHAADWHELADEGENPIDYRGAQVEVMRRVIVAIRRAVTDRSFEARLQAKLVAALEAPADDVSPIRNLVETFGRGGDRVVAEVLLEQMLLPLAAAAPHRPPSSLQA